MKKFEMKSLEEKDLRATMATDDGTVEIYNIPLSIKEDLINEIERLIEDQEDIDVEFEKRWKLKLIAECTNVEFDKDVDIFAIEKPSQELKMLVAYMDLLIEEVFEEVLLSIQIFLQKAKNKAIEGGIKELNVEINNTAKDIIKDKRTSNKGLHRRRFQK